MQTFLTVVTHCCSFVKRFRRRFKRQPLDTPLDVITQIIWVIGLVTGYHRYLWRHYAALSDYKADNSRPRKGAYRPAINLHRSYCATSIMRRRVGPPVLLTGKMGYPPVIVRCAWEGSLRDGVVVSYLINATEFPRRKSPATARILMTSKGADQQNVPRS